MNPGTLPGRILPFKAQNAPEPYIPAAFGVPVPLPTIVRRAGMEYRQCFREGDVTVYFAKGLGNRCEYEVFWVQVLPAGEIGGKSYPTRESFPSSSQWVECGWTYANRSHRDPLAAAMAKAQQISARKDSLGKIGAGIEQAVAV